ncbi:putative thymine dioxygenase [Triangularia verruculosa]|uniref:Thymine dioxygenase n=1 Tax=Triangularia verruculosa TaxID=2587418 RepID=A0AAN6XF21_9PEZI|nr:putative thymine dioxygenase [Triangularia verruculosa]
MVSTAVEQDGLVIPIINFSPFLTGPPSSRLATAKSILSAFQTSGFLYLSHTPIPPHLLTTVFTNSASLFSHPASFKNKYLWTTPSANRGYSAPGREKVTQLTSPSLVSSLRTSTPDLKESFEIGRENEPDHPNLWPESPDLPQFRNVMQDFHKRCHELNVQVMRAIAVGMGLHENFFDGYVDKADNTLRLLHYPPVAKEKFVQGAVRAGEHSDYGSITLLFQDQRGGLQVRAPNGVFVDAKPVEGTVVVNAGDLLARWANESFKSTIHRVVEPPPSPTDQEEEGEGGGVEEYPARYSVAYFCNPNFDSFIEAIPGTYGGEKGEKKYEGIYSGEYIVQRLAATY